MYFELGSSLVEILISMFLVSLMLLGLDAMHLMALHEAKNSYYFSAAMQQLQNMAERLDSVNNADLIKQMAEWNKQNQEILPQGRGVVSGQYPFIHLAIFWGNVSEASCASDKIGQSGCLHLSL